MDYRCLRRLLFLTRINYSYRFYSRNISQRKDATILNSLGNTVTSQHDNFKSDQNKDSSNRVLPQTNTTLNKPHYKKLEKTDSELKKILHTFRNRKLRERRKEIILEGASLINLAIDAQIKFHNLFFCNKKDLQEINIQRPLGEDPKLFKIAPSTMQLLSSTSQVIGVFERPTYEYIKGLREPVLPVTIICDNIRDPGNIGCIIRLAAVTGSENVLLLKGCADPWDAKALKVGSGGQFCIPIINNMGWTDVSNYIYKDSKIFIADNSSDIEPWEQTEELINYDEEIEDDTTETAMLEQNKLQQKNSSNELDILEDIDLPCYLYSSVMYPKEKIVLYVGGETHGVDARIVKLASDYGGKKVKIPLENRMDSLNSSFALSIILYEIKRQLSKKL